MFVAILLILFLLFILWPVIKVWLVVRRTRQQMREAYNRAYEQAFGTPPPGAGKRSKSTASSNRGKDPHSRHRKIIEKDVGEYVDFEELRVYDDGTTQTVSHTSVKAESQIEDVEWEDI